MLLDGTLDAALIRGRVRTADLWSAPVWSEKIVAAMPHHHPLSDRSSVTVAELASSPVALTAREINPALHDLLTGALAPSGLALSRGILFTTVEATYAQLAAQATPMWTPVFEGYEAEHHYEGIRAILIEPHLHLPTFLVAAAHTTLTTRRALLDACAQAS